MSSTTVRIHPITGEAVLLAPERGRRPNAFVDGREKDDGFSPSDCSFCAGHETETPRAVFELVKRGHWRVRVFPNKYPAITPQSGGRHEVIVESHRHGRQIDELSSSEMTDVVRVYINRSRILSRAGTVKAIALFKNQGKGSGQSIDHLHSQIVALPFVPPRLAALAQGFARIAVGGECPHCALANEPKPGRRWIEANESFLLATAFASRFPYEMIIVPLRHASSFHGLTKREIVDLAHMMQTAVRALRRSLSDPPFNWVVQNGPVHTRDSADSFHWYVEIAPRVTQLGGYELGPGGAINIVTPEAAATVLRGALGKRKSKETHR